MTLVDVVLALAFMWFVLRIEWPTEEHDHPFHDDDQVLESSPLATVHAPSHAEGTS